jgi:hypothetical protein
MRQLSTINRGLRRFLLLVLPVFAVVVSCSEDDPTEPEIPPPPAPGVLAYSDSTVVPGDTILITGSNFLETAASNRVEFANPLAVVTPLYAEATLLRVVVPDDAASGPVRVTVSGQSQAGTGPPLEVLREIGEGWVFGGIGENYPLKLPFDAAGTEYLMVPYGANPGIATHIVNTYTIANDDITAYPFPPVLASQTAPATTTVQERFDRHLHEQLREIAGSGHRVTPAGTGRDISLAPQAPAQTRQFNVLNTAVGSTLLAANYTQVTALLRYNGTHCLIYSDVDTLASGNLTQSDYDNFGDQFDNQIHPTNTTHFGTESDIDGNGKVIILMSGVINGLPATDPQWNGTYYIGGFFSPVDLFAPGGSIQQGTTNQAEMFYVLAADPDGEYLGPNFKFPRAYVAEVNLQTIAHEYQHLISASNRLLVHGIEYIQELWLEEGMSHMAEDLNNMDGSNLGRANLFLAQPGYTSVEHPDAPLAQRGGIYLFLRYLGDRFGDTIYRGILQSKCLGRDCIETITGEDFYDTFGDFMATLYLSGKGITSDPMYNYSSIDLAGFQPVPYLRRVVGSGAASGTVKRTSGQYYLFTNPGSPAGQFVFTQSTRAGMRFMIVRTK